MPKSHKQLPKLQWASEPAAHDYPSAESFLDLIATAGQVAGLVRLLAKAPTIDKHAKDILRASRLPLLPADDPEVAKDLKRVGKKIPLSPVLLVRGDLSAGVPLQIVDGYHRVCASYHLNEDTEIACRLVSLATTADQPGDDHVSSES
jgi:hypothetical protein